MKQIYTVLFLFLSFTLAAQIPSGYYNTATGTGYTLKTQLHNIINNHNDQGYDAIDAFIATYDLDNYYETSSNTILDVYSENPSGTDPYNFTPEIDECGEYDSEGDCYNKEHVIPQSVFNSISPMQGDAHHLLPTDGRVNGFRSNNPYGRVNDSQLVNQSGINNPTQNGSKLGNNLNSGYSAGYTNVVFEPIDEFKGDIARIYFYFVTRYQDQMSAWSAYDMFDGSSDKALADPFLTILMTWHENDPVSQKEIDRNNNIYYNHQGNRNPFIDHPEYVALIWNETADTEAPTAPTNLVALNPADSSIELNWNAATDNIAVASYDIYMDDIFHSNTTMLSATISGLAADTNYCFKVKAKDQSGNESPFSNEACETTTNNGASESDLFFSEYMEGSSNNKALEIANFTGNTINLADYSLKLSANGNASWTTTYTFPVNAEILHQDVYVIANGGLAVCTNVVDNLNNSITGFNGNDAIGLFKNEVLIDIIGTLGDATVFGENTTLVRKPEITAPTTLFDTNQWNNFPSNTCDDLGQHTQTLGINEESYPKTVKLFPNPVQNQLTVSLNEPGFTTIKIYTVLGKKVIDISTDQTTVINTSNLVRGVYIVSIKQGKHQTTQKLIKQ